MPGFSNKAHAMLRRDDWVNPWGGQTATDGEDSAQTSSTYDGTINAGGIAIVAQNGGYNGPDIGAIVGGCLGGAAAIVVGILIYRYCIKRGSGQGTHGPERPGLFARLKGRFSERLPPMDMSTESGGRRKKEHDEETLA
ncbi:MAG: hypothetical protein Q9190_002623 [Brigantiaea leucoxantha]